MGVSQKIKLKHEKNTCSQKKKLPSRIHLSMKKHNIKIICMFFYELTDNQMIIRHSTRKLLWWSR